MEFYKHLIIYSAIIIGSVLLFFGIRDIKLKNIKKGGLFWATLLSVLFFSSCATSQENTNDMNFTIEQSKRIQKLNETIEWQEFKAFWQSLDAESPDVQPFYEDKKIKSFQSYSIDFSEDEDKYKKSIELMESTLKNLRNVEYLSETELEILFIICEKRIDKLFRFDPMLISHFAPPKINQNYGESVEKIELKIDTLNILAESNTISEDEYKKSLMLINTEINNMLTVGTIVSTYKDYIYEGAYTDENTVENNLLYFENHFEKLIEKEGENGESKKQYDEIKKNLSVLDDNINSLDEIINDLVANKISRIDALEKTDAFEEFKELWEEIDKLEPKNGTYEHDSYDDFVEIGDMKQVLDDRMKKIEETNLLCQQEINVLRLLAFTRLDALQGPNIYTRAMIPMTYTPKSTFELEYKIDILLDLKKNEQIDNEEYQNALLQIFNLSDQIIILAMLNTDFFFYPIEEQEVLQGKNVIEEYKKIVEEHYSKLLKEGNIDDENFESHMLENYSSSMEKLNEIQAVLPTIHVLIKRLEEKQ